jgi:O-antigen/teichoic acid export membrane protein
VVNIPKDKDNYTEHIVKGSALIFFMSVLTNIVGYLIRIFLARSLTPEDYGLIYTAISLLGILNIMRNLGFSDTLRKKIPEYIVKKSYIKIKSAMIFSFIVEFAYTLAIFLIIFIFAGYLSDNLFHSLRGIDVLILLAISGIVQVFYGVIQSAFQGLKKVRLYTTLDFFVYLLRFVFIVALIPFGILALPLSYLITSIIMTVVAVTIFRFRFSFIAKAKAVITKKFSKRYCTFQHQ